MKDKLAILKWYRQEKCPQIDYERVDKDFCGTVYDGSAIKDANKYQHEVDYPQHSFLVRFNGDGTFSGYAQDSSSQSRKYGCIGKKLENGKMVLFLFNKLSCKDDTVDPFNPNDTGGQPKRGFFDKLFGREQPRKTVPQYRIIVVDADGTQLSGGSFDWQYEKEIPTGFEWGPIGERLANFSYCRCKKHYFWCSRECHGVNPNCESCNRKCKDGNCKKHCSDCTHVVPVDQCSCAKCPHFISRSEFEAEKLKTLSDRVILFFEDLTNEQKDLIVDAPDLIDEEIRKISS